MCFCNWLRCEYLQCVSVFGCVEYVQHTCCQTDEEVLLIFLLFFLKFYLFVLHLCHHIRACECVHEFVHACEY